MFTWINMALKTNSQMMKLKFSKKPLCFLIVKETELWKMKVFIFL